MIVVSFTLALLSFHYQHVIKPVCQDIIRFKLFAKRDELRRLAISGAVDMTSFTYRHLEDMINTMANATTWYSVSIWIESMVWKSSHPESQQEAKTLMEKFEAQASDDEKRIEQNVMKLIFVVMAANSPGWMIIVSVSLVMSSVKAQFGRWNRALWYRIENGYRPIHA